MIKYTMPFRDDYDVLYRVDMDFPSYSGDPIEIRGVGRKCCIPEWNAGTDEAFTPIVTSKVTISFYQQGQVDIEELMGIVDMQVRCHVYRNEVLWWTGYLVPDGIQRMFQSDPYPVTVIATDGLKLLESIPFTGVNNWPMHTGAANRSPLAFVREVLFRSIYLNQPLPIRWASDVECVEYPSEDALAGTITWGARGEAWTDFNGNYRSCWYVLENMVKAFQCRFFQFGAKWHLYRIPEIVSGTYDWKEIDTVFGPSTPPIMTTGTDDVNAEIGTDGYLMVMDNHVITVKPAASDVKVTYDNYQAENIIPNGGFDLWSSTAGAPLYWGFELNSGANPEYDQYDSLNGNYGQSVEIVNTGTASARFTFANRLPVDANKLFRRMTWGFTFMPLNGFLHVVRDDENPENIGTLTWEDNPLRARVSYEAYDKMGDLRTMYLNAFGYWQWEPLGGYFRFTDSTWDGDDNVIYRFSGEPVEGEVIHISFGYDPGAGSGSELEHTRFSYTVTSATAGSLLGTIAAFAASAQAAIEVSPGLGPMIESYVTNIIGDEVELIFDTHLNNITAYTNYIIGGNQGLLPGNWLSITVPELKMGDIAGVVFQGKGGNSEIIFPNPGPLNWTDIEQTAATGTLKVEFAILPDQRYVLDDVWMRVDDNNDVYQSFLPTAQARSLNTEEVSLGISSSFSGFMHSNIMTSYDKSNVEYRFTDGHYTGSLTGMTANAMMRFRGTPSQIFNGSIATGGAEWLYHHIYEIETLEGKKFMPTGNVKYNMETGIVDLVAMECRDDRDTNYDEKHYASNDTILSN